MLACSRRARMNRSTSVCGQSACFTQIDAEEWDDAAKKFDVTDFPTMLIIEGKNSKGYIVYPESFADAEDRDKLVVAIDEILANR